MIIIKNSTKKTSPKKIYYLLLFAGFLYLPMIKNINISKIYSKYGIFSFEYFLFIIFPVILLITLIIFALQRHFALKNLHKKNDLKKIEINNKEIKFCFINKLKNIKFPLSEIEDIQINFITAYMYTKFSFFPSGKNIEEITLSFAMKNNETYKISYAPFRNKIGFIQNLTKYTKQIPLSYSFIGPIDESSAKVIREILKSKENANIFKTKEKYVLASFIFSLLLFIFSYFLFSSISSIFIIYLAINIYYDLVLLKNDTLWDIRRVNFLKFVFFLILIFANFD